MQNVFTPDAAALAPGNAVTLASVGAAWNSLGIDNAITEGRSRICLGKIEVPKHLRGRGIGTRALEMLCEYADFSGQSVLLTPSKEFGATSIGRLEAFYKGLGFVRNKGVHKNFTISDAMYRAPIPHGRIPEVDAYPMAHPDEWYGHCEYEKAGGRLVGVSPAAYIAEVRSLQIDEASRDCIDDLKNHIRALRPIDPVLIMSNGAEDGRHRAHACRELGILSLPVIAYDKHFPSAADWDGPVLRSRLRQALRLET